MLGEPTHRPLQVVSDDAHRRVLEDRPEGREDGDGVEAARQVEPASGDGDVAGRPRTGREREADEPFARGRRRHRQHVEAAPACLAQRPRELREPRLGGHRAVVGLDRLRRRRELVQQRLEPQLGEQREAPFPVRPLVAVAGRILVQGHVDADADELAAAARVLGVLGQGRPQLLLRQPGRPLQQPVESAELGDEAPRALLAHPGDALDVVAGVSHQREDVDHLVRPHPELLPHPGLVEPRAIVPRVEDVDPVVDELKEVLVAGDDGDVEPRLDRPRGEGADDVVGLEAPAGDDGHAEGRARLVYPGDLLDEVGGHRTPVGLVVGRELVAEGRPLQIESGRDELGGLLGHQLAQHGDEAEHRVGRASVGARQPPDRVVGAVHLGVAVDEEETGSGGHEVRPPRGRRWWSGAGGAGRTSRQGAAT